MSNRLVPRLRFKEFNNQWLNKNLNNFSNIIMGQSPLSKNYTDDNSSYLLIQGNADLKEGKIFPRLYTTQVTKITRKNDIILTVRAPVGEVAINNYGNAVIGRGVSSITGNYFLYSMFNYFKLSNYWNKFSTGSTFDSIDSNTLQNVKINVPSLSEQQKIGQFFSKLDRLIELQSQKLSHLKQLKKGYLQKMFPQKGKNIPRLRFNGFHDEWNKKELSKLASIKTGNKNVEDNVKGGKYAFFDRSTQIKYLNTYDYDDEVIVYAGEGSNFLPKYFYGKYSLHQRAYGLYNFNNISPVYLYYFLNTKSNTFVRFSVGTTAKSLRKDTFKHVYVNIPSIQEQNQIGQFFKHLDQYISQQKNKLTQLKQLKKGYLQKMFI